MRLVFSLLVAIFVSACTPYTVEEYEELMAKEQKWNGPTGTVCMRTSHGQQCNYSGR